MNTKRATAQRRFTVEVFVAALKIVVVRFGGDARGRVDPRAWLRWRRGCLHWRVRTAAWVRVNPNPFRVRVGV